LSIPLIQPFAALRPAAGRGQDVAARPYDVLSFDEAMAGATGRPWSFLHVSRAEIDLAPGTDPYATGVYARAAENLARMVEAGVLIREAGRCYYVWRMTRDGHVQTGIAAAASIDAYVSNRIRRHELTRPDKETDRTRQIEAVGAHTGPVLVAYPDDAGVAAVLARAAGAVPDLEAVTDDGTRHQIWVVADEATIDDLTRRFEAMDAVYIADGHHRSAAAARVAEDRRLEDPGHLGEAPWETFLTVGFPASEVVILDYNRIVRDLNGLTPSAFLSMVHTRFVVGETDRPARPRDRGMFGMYLDSRWYQLMLKHPPAADAGPVERLDISLLTDRLLTPVLGIGDPRLDKRIDFVGGGRGLEALEQRVDSGDWAVAFALYPTALADLMTVADAGEIMPPKSTWFEPKLADGLLSLPLD
jgi:uncharacterized protein (DUF1015 family)